VAAARCVIRDRADRGRVRAQHGLADGLPTVELLELCPGLDEVIRPFASLEGGSPPVDLALLRALARSFPACRYLEIGSWRGESLANVAEVAERCVSVSLGTDRVAGMLAGELSGATGQAAAMASQLHCFSRGLPNVTIVPADSRRFDFSPLEGAFDLVFVDGDHAYDVVLSDTRNAFRLLRGPDSIVIWHDYAETPESVRWSVLRAILDGCPDGEARSRLRHVSNTLCAVYTRRPLPAGPPTTSGAAPTKSFAVRVTAEPLPARARQVDDASAERSSLPLGPSGSPGTSANERGTR
jgi:predicted O-methyltransferase YrrM